MKINWTVRLKNPWFWASLAGVILTAMDVSPATLTSWHAIREAVVSLAGNPYMLGSVALAVLGVLIDPTTKGIRDSQQALTYEKPKEDTK